MIGLNSDNGHLSTVPSLNGKYAIEARNLHVFYGDFLAIKDVNLQIERQKVTAIIAALPNPTHTPNTRRAHR